MVSRDLQKILLERSLTQHRLFPFADWDTSPKNRKFAPSFYGFVPDSANARALCFLSMFTLSFAHVLGRTIAIALLFITEPVWLAIYLGADVLFVFLYKIVRRDFGYWINVPAKVRFFASIIFRLMDKAMTDATLMFQMRHPQELGGHMFILSMLTSQASLFASAWLYIDYNNPDEDDMEGSGSPTKIDGEVLWTAASCLFALWLASGVAFLAVLKREYLHTFIGGDTAATLNRKLFLALRDDQEKAKSEFFDHHPEVRKLYQDELKQWTMSNWRRFEDTKPEWFTDGWIHKVPNDYMPFEFRVKYKKTKGRVDDPKNVERRGSVSVRELLGGESAPR